MKRMDFVNGFSPSAAFKNEKKNCSSKKMYGSRRRRKKNKIKTLLNPGNLKRKSLKSNINAQRHNPVTSFNIALSFPKDNELLNFE